jgi:hypothetical protein
MDSVRRATDQRAKVFAGAAELIARAESIARSGLEQADQIGEIAICIHDCLEKGRVV